MSSIFGMHVLYSNTDSLQCNPFNVRTFITNRRYEKILNNHVELKCKERDVLEPSYLEAYHQMRRVPDNICLSLRVRVYEAHLLHLHDRTIPETSEHLHVRSTPVARLGVFGAP